MTYPILIDENTSPRVASLLREDGHDAQHVTEALTSGARDEAILEYAVETDAVLLTNDDDFLGFEDRRSVPVHYYSDDTLAAREIVVRVRQLIEYVPDPEDLPAVTNLEDWQ